MRRAGYTVLELCITLTLLSVVVSSAFAIVRSGQDVMNRSVSDSTINIKANRALNRIVRRIRGAGRETLFPQPMAPFSSDNISFQEIAGWDGEIVWNEDVAFLLEYEPGELDNDIDDDGDGFVDECRIVQVENFGQPDEARVVVTSAVSEFLEGETGDGTDENGNGLEDERGLCFELDGGELVIRLSVVQWDPDGSQTTRTLETSVSMRN